MIEAIKTDHAVAQAEQFPLQNTLAFRTLKPDVEQVLTENVGMTHQNFLEWAENQHRGYLEHGLDAPRDDHEEFLAWYASREKFVKMTLTYMTLITEAEAAKMYNDLYMNIFLKALSFISQRSPISNE